MKNLLWILFLVPLTGCASGGMNSTCAHISGAEMTVPYIGGKGNADVYACHMGCVGSKCPPPDYAALKELTTTYLNSTGGKIATSGPGVITFTPSAK